MGMLLLHCSNFIVDPFTPAVKREFPMPPQKVIIKKYENRRLYDTTNSRYVNLEEVAQMLREGIEVQAVDVTTGEDITRLILTQIIVEGAKDRDSALPLDFLRQMVIATGKASQETLLKYMRTMFDMYQTAYRGFTPSISPLDFMQTILAPGARPEAGRTAPGPPAPAGQEHQTEVSELRRRIDELEKLIATGPSKRRKNVRSRRKAPG